MRDVNGRYTSQNVGAENSKWMADAVGYDALHTWVQREKGKASFCVDCGSSKSVQWANISKTYKRDVNDWKSLCCVCHRRFDGITKLSREEADQIRERYESGERQLALAKEFGVDQGTVSNIVNHKIQYYG